MYDIARREGHPQSAAHEGEFWAYHLLTLALIGAKAKEDGSGGRLELTTNFMVRSVEGMWRLAEAMRHVRDACC